MSDLELMKGGLLEAHALLLLVRRAEQKYAEVHTEEEKVVKEAEKVLAEARALSALREASALKGVEAAIAALRDYQKEFASEYSVALELMPAPRGGGHTRL